MHETAVLNLANRLYGGGICDTDRAVSMLNGRKAEVWQVSDPVPIRFTNDTITNLYDQL
jgi:maleamate amidohydrolase